MRMLVCVKLLVGVLVVSSCVSCATGRGFTERTPESRDMGIIYLYRPFVWEGINTSPQILLDGKSQGNLRTRGYMDFDVEPGVHTIKTEGNRSWTTMESIGVHVRGGDIVWVRLEMSEDEIQEIDLHTGKKTGHLKPRFRKVHAMEARKEIQRTRRSGPR